MNTCCQHKESDHNGEHTQKKKLFVKTWGCQMNVYDSHKMADILSSLGYESVTQPEGADMIILNTCHIREKATDKVFSELGRLKTHKINKEKQGETMLLAVAGCVAQAEGDLIFSRAPYVDLIIGPQSYHKLPEMILDITGGCKNRVINTDFPTETKFDTLPEESLKQGPSAFLSVQEGCDKFCTFCVVPYTRGSEYSRPPHDIRKEALRLVDLGAKEVTLLGQNVNAYHGKNETGQTSRLADLIADIANINGIERIRYTTSHPRDMDDALIQAHKDIPELMPFLHLPIQSGSDKILKAMNRKHDSDQYRDIIQQLRKARPDIAMSSDFIVGFPGETDEDFEDTMRIVRDIEYVYAYSFKYSPRPGTPAANMNAMLPENVKSERLQRLQNLLNEQQYNYNKNYVTTYANKTVPVLFDRYLEEKGQLQGRTPHNQAIHVQGNKRLVGQILDVKITSGGPNSLTGDIIMADNGINDGYHNADAA